MLKYFSLFLAVAYLSVCTVLLTLPGSAFPEENWFSKVALDKWIHIGMFATMVLVIVWSVFKMKQNGISVTQIIIIATLCLGYGIAMEFVQKYWVINRSFDGFDIIADGVGSGIGAWLSLRWFTKDRPL